MIPRVLALCLVPLFFVACSDSPSQPEPIQASLVPMVAGGPVIFEVIAEYDWNLGHWLPGTTTGDIEGELFITFSGPGRPPEQVTGWAYHFYEEWEIRDEQGDLIVAGYNNGTESPNTLPTYPLGADHFVADGRITAASDEWSHLIDRVFTARGWMVYEPATIATGIWTIR